MRRWILALVTSLGTFLLFVITSSNIIASPSDPNIAIPILKDQSDKMFAQREESERRRQEQREIRRRAEEERKQLDDLSRIEREKFLRSQQTQKLFSVFKASCKRATKGGRDPYGRTFTAEFQEKLCDCIFEKLTGSNDLLLVRDFIKLEGGNQLTTDSHPMASFMIEQSIGICVLEPTVPGLR